MKRRFVRVFAPKVMALALVALLLSNALPDAERGTVSVAHAASPLAWQYKMATIPSWWDGDLYNSAPALQQLADAGANTVTLVTTWYLDSVYSTDIYRTQGTASDDSLRYAIQQARARGLQVLLKPHIDTHDGQWRAMINPGDANAFFASYTAMMNHYADLASQQGVLGLCVGAELISMSNNPAYDSRWRTLIGGIRARFGGTLTYSANWGGEGFTEEYPKIPFWDALDQLGISAYFELSGNTTPSVQSLNASWANWKATKIAPFQQRWNKPVFFTEVGYRSVDGAARQPWNWDASGSLDTQEQVDCYESLFQTWGSVPWFVGAAFWQWDTNANVSGTSTDYPIQNKPAYGTMRNWFTQQVAVTQVPPTATRVPPTVTPMPPTATRTPPTATTAPPTATRTLPTATTVPPTATRTLPTATTISATATRAPTATATTAPATATSPPTTGRPFTVRYAVSNDWGAGYVVNVNPVNNTAATVNGWTISWKVTHSESLAYFWNATCTISGDTVTCRNADYNATLAPNGGTQDFGVQFNSTHDGSYTNGASYPPTFTVNGVIVAR